MEGCTLVARNSFPYVLAYNRVLYYCTYSFCLCDISGIAIAYLTLVDNHGNKVVVQPSDPYLNCVELNRQEHMDILNQLVILKKKETLSPDEPNMCMLLY